MCGGRSAHLMLATTVSHWQFHMHKMFVSCKSTEHGEAPLPARTVATAGIPLVGKLC